MPLQRIQSPFPAEDKGKDIIMENSHLTVAIYPQQYVHRKRKCDQISGTVNILLSQQLINLIPRTMV